jgi:hypothetical protein
MLQWARANGCDWDARTCSEAARLGHLAVVEWARANGCDCDAYMLEWLRANGCFVECGDDDAEEDDKEED